MSNIRCVLFDLDGVLIDACEWHFHALNIALEKVVGSSISREDHEKKFNGLPTKVKLKMLGISSEDSAVINRLKQEHTVGLIEKNVTIDHVKIELLSHLKKNNILTACVTNSIRNNTILMLEKSGMIEYLDVVVTNEDVQRNKPEPDCYNLAIKKLSADPSKTLCVEDSTKGILSARASLAKHIWEVENPDKVNLENYKRLWL